MALIKCYECGASISDRAVTCPQCGAPIKSDTGNNLNIAPNIQNHNDNSETDVQRTETQQVEIHPKKKKSKLGLILIVAIIVIALIVAGIVALIKMNSKASDEQIQNEAKNLISVSEMMGLKMEVAGASRSQETGMPTILYVMQYPDGSSEFRGMSADERGQFDDAVNTLLKTLSTSLQDNLKEPVVVGINVMSARRSYDFLGVILTDEPEVVAEYYDYGDEAKNRQVQQAASDKVEDEYNQLVELAKEKKYQEAMDFYNSSSLSESFDGYSDSKKYFFYAQAMSYYDLTCYGEAYEMIEEYCEDILDSQEILKTIEDKVFYLDGLYKNESVNYDMYMSIRHGRVTYEFGDGGKAPSDASYLETLMDYEFTTGKRVYASTYNVVPGETAEPRYIIEEMDGKLLVGGAPGASETTFSGLYKKVSSTPISPRD